MQEVEDNSDGENNDNNMECKYKSYVYIVSKLEPKSEEIQLPRKRVKK